jgi:hypothetical protein
MYAAVASSASSVYNNVVESPALKETLLRLQVRPRRPRMKGLKELLKSPNPFALLSPFPMCSSRLFPCAVQGGSAEDDGAPGASKLYLVSS